MHILYVNILDPNYELWDRCQVTIPLMHNPKTWGDRRFDLVPRFTYLLFYISERVISHVVELQLRGANNFIVLEITKLQKR
jgi:hypothetical protein